MTEPEERAVALEMALRAIFEWYDTDGSAGGASDVFEDARRALAIYSQDQS